jgi:1-pyrroline-5-carboxylate dehydrogenase
MSLPKFRNAPSVDFTRPEVEAAMRSALAAVESQFGRRLRLVIGGEHREADGTFPSMNPSNHAQIVAYAPQAGADHVSDAVAAALRASTAWKRTEAQDRAALLLRAAEILRRRRLEIAAWMIFEVGKNWPEADGEVAEAIDHLEYCAREVLRYDSGQPTAPHARELASYTYEPLGVVAVISPWNFPLALTIGMAAGALAAGNTIVLKPSSESPASAAVVGEVMEEAGLPPGVLNFVTGRGEIVGERLVEDPRIRMVAFTGSRDVGCRIYERAAKVQKGQIWLKRVIAELGGKNAVVIDDEADVEDAVTAAIVSGYSYQGQKCAAGSRLIVSRSIYRDVVERFVDQVRRLDVGPGKENHTLGPVISKRAMETILEYIRTGASEGTLLAGGEPGERDGFYIQPTVIAGVDRHARIAQEEIFGPVVAVIEARDFDDALSIANGTIYGLSGAVFTRNVEKIARARREFACGNLYINRKCTGSEVGAHPFGGFHMSGTDAKIGGPDYLLHFLQPKVTSIKYR